MADVKDLSNALKNVHLNGMINDCIVFVRDNKFRIQAMDIANSLFVQTKGDIVLDDVDLGIGEINILFNYLNKLTEADVKLTVDDNILIIKPSKGTIVKYLMSETDLVPSYDEEWPENMFKQELENYEHKFTLGPDVISSFLTMVQTFATNTIFFETDGKKLYIHGGRETEHQFFLPIGKAKGAPKMQTQVYSKNLSSIFRVINSEAYIYLKENSDVIITSETAGWIIRPQFNE